MAAIGIMGGTFNPIHLGHIEIAKAAFFQYRLDEIWFMPNHIPGYKSNKSLVSGKARFEMTKLAIADIPYFKASDYELKRTGNTYTAETLELLNQEYPKDCFYFIMGADSLNYFEQWKNPELIIKYATILVASRDGLSASEMEAKIQELNAIYSGNPFHLIQCKNIPCSSSSIRHKLLKMYQQNKENEMQHFEKIAAALCLPVSVYQYIIKYNLYNQI